MLSLGRNVQLVHADLSDKNVMLSAFAGADVIYLVTDYWNVQTSPHAPDLNTEIMNGVTAIEAAAETPSLKHLIFGTLLDYPQLTNVKFRNMYHFSEIQLGQEYNVSFELTGVFFRYQNSPE
jgi:hypothetical protein